MDVYFKTICGFSLTLGVRSLLFSAVSIMLVGTLVLFYVCIWDFGKPDSKPGGSRAKTYRCVQRFDSRLYWWTVEFLKPTHFRGLGFPVFRAIRSKKPIWGTHTTSGISRGCVAQNPNMVSLNTSTYQTGSSWIQPKQVLKTIQQRHKHLHPQPNIKLAFQSLKYNILKGWLIL